MIRSESELPGSTGWTWLVWEHAGDGRFVVSHALPPMLYATVLADLRAKHGQLEPFNLKWCQPDEPLYHLDYGGMACLAERKISIVLPGERTIECYAHHGLDLRQHVDRLLGDESKWRPGPPGSSWSWVKLRGWHHLCCVTIDDLVVLRDALGAEKDLVVETQAFVAQKNAMIDSNPGLTRPGKVWGKRPGS